MFPNQIKDVAIDQVPVAASLGSASFSAYEQDGSALSWAVRGTILCATVA